MINSAKEFSFNHLNSTQFEEFCFDLLECLDFKNVNWRKGTGYSSSPSDQGRDIECERLVKDIDGEVFIEKWFVECKHYKFGVPPEKIQSALSWAQSQKPDCVLIIASNFLSNPCKNYIENYNIGKPPFKIKYWEIKTLEKLTQSQSLLLKKFNVGCNFSFFNVMHPCHLLYIRRLHSFTLDAFFKAMDSVEVTKRDSILTDAYMHIIRPEFKKPITGKEKLRDLLIDEISYEHFKIKCYEIEKNNQNISVANYVTDIVLKSCFYAGDITTVDQSLKQLESMRESLQDELKNSSSSEAIEDILDSVIDNINTLKDRNRECYLLYTFFCEHVLTFLFMEETRKIVDMGPINLQNFQ
jgi:Restriction endonuclease.